jgi:predicted dehydrogenase
MSDIDVALVGYGLAGAAFHAPLIETTPGLRLVAIVTANPERQAQARRENPNAEIVPTFDALLARPRPPDVIVVATPNRTHAPFAIDALRAGCAVVVDKPFAATAADARAVIAEAEARRRLLTVFQNRRWDGDFLTVQRLKTEGRLGDVFRFESRYERWRPATRDNWRERDDPADAGGLLFDLGSHLIDQALVLFGPVTHVYAELDRRRPESTVDDDVFVALTHGSGVRSHLWASVMVARPGPRMRVLGPQGTYTKFGMDVQEAALRAGVRPNGDGWGVESEDGWGVLAADGRTEVVPTERGDYPAFYRLLRDALVEATPPPVAAQDALNTLQIIEAARRSALERSVVALSS